MYKVALIQFPGNGITRWETAQWCTHAFYALTTKFPKVECVDLKYYNDTPITMTRNKAIRDCLESDIDYIYMIDSDIIPDMNFEGSKQFLRLSWEFMLGRRDSSEELPYATIGAPYCGPPPHENIYVFYWENYESGDKDNKFHLVQYSREHAYGMRGITEVAALPTGLILYDARIFKELPRPWFAYEWKDEYACEKASTEDVYQTRNASLMGFPQYCAWDSWAIHIKSKYVARPSPVSVEDIAYNMRDALLKNRRRNPQ